MDDETGVYRLWFWSKLTQLVASWDLNAGSLLLESRLLTSAPEFRPGSKNFLKIEKSDVWEGCFKEKGFKKTLQFSCKIFLVFLFKSARSPTWIWDLSGSIVPYITFVFWTECLLGLKLCSPHSLQSSQVHSCPLSRLDKGFAMPKVIKHLFP